MLLPLIFCLAAALLEVAFLGHLRPLGVMPNLVVIAVTLAALWSQASPTLVAALAAGLVLDSASGVDFGLRTAFLAALAVSAIAARQLGLHADSLVAAAGIVAVATVLFNLAVIAGLPAAALNWQTIGTRIGLELAVNLLLTAAIWAVGSLWRNRQPVLVDSNRSSWL